MPLETALLEPSTTASTVMPKTRPATHAVLVTLLTEEHAPHAPTDALNVRRIPQVISPASMVGPVLVGWSITTTLRMPSKTALDISAVLVALHALHS